MDIEYQIPRSALVWTLVSVVLVMLPQLTRMPPWVIAIAGMCIVWRSLIYAGRLDFPSRTVRTIVVLLTLVLSASQLRNIGVGLDSAASLLALGFVFKLIEMRYKRDIYIVISLCFVMAMVAFLYSQSALITLYITFAVIVITGAMIALNRNNRSGHNRGILLLAGKMTLQALPLTIVLFMVFPRIAPLWAVPIPSGGGTTGVTDEISPGDIARLGRSADLAFRVQFERGTAPPHSELYWRGLVLDDFDGITWRRGRSSNGGVDFSDPRFQWQGRVEAGGNELEYNVILEPTRQPWIFGLHLAEPLTRNLLQTRNFELFNNGLITQRLNYDLRTYPATRTDVLLLDYARRRNVELPELGNNRARAFARDMRDSVDSDRAYINAVLSHFRLNPYYYTLNPPILGENRIDEFLFDTLEGFCEHYASTFAFLMRAVGIPTRVVVGYQGAEYNRFEDYMMIYQYNAHAWNEVWLEGEGWVRFDPTGAVSPDRINLGVEAALRDDPSFLEESLFSAARLGGINWINNLRLRLDAIEYEWNRRVVSFDEDVQTQLFENLFGEVTERKVILVLLGLASVAIIGVGLTVIRIQPARPVSASDKLYRRLCRELERVGLGRETGEGPLSYRDRVIAARPDLEPAMQEFTEHYLDLNYRVAADRQQSLTALRRTLSRLRQGMSPLRRGT